MTSPGGPTPDGTITGGDLAPLDGLEEQAWRDSIAGPEVDRFNAAGSIWRQAWADQFTQVADLTDGQLDIAHRTDLLREVTGYGSAVMGMNWRVPTDSSWVDVPFDVQLGPAKHVSVVAGEKSGHLVLDGGGLWRVDLMMCGRGATTRQGMRWQSVGSGGFFIPTYTAYPARIDYRILVTQTSTLIARRDFTSSGVPYSTYSESVDTATDQVLKEMSVSFPTTFVFDPGIGAVTVQVQARVVPLSSGWLDTSQAQIFGGTKRSALVVTRWSTDDIDNFFISNPPDGGTL